MRDFFRYFPQNFKAATMALWIRLREPAKRYAQYAIYPISTESHRDGSLPNEAYLLLPVAFIAASCLLLLHFTFGVLYHACDLTVKGIQTRCLADDVFYTAGTASSKAIELVAGYGKLLGQITDAEIAEFRRNNRNNSQLDLGLPDELTLISYDDPNNVGAMKELSVYTFFNFDQAVKAEEPFDIVEVVGLRSMMQ